LSAHCVSASDDIVEPELTRRLLRDLREVRQAKARKGIETIGDTHLQMDNLGMMEINEIRFLNQALDRLRMLSTAKYNNPEEEESVDSNEDFGSADYTSEN
jgi:GINS complex subunit 2